MTNDELIQSARAVVNPRKIAHGFTIGDVGCALVTEVLLGKDNIVKLRELLPHPFE